MLLLDSPYIPRPSPSLQPIICNILLPTLSSPIFSHSDTISLLILTSLLETTLYLSIFSSAGFNLKEGDVVF